MDILAYKLCHWKDVEYQLTLLSIVVLVSTNLGTLIPKVNVQTINFVFNQSLLENERPAQPHA